MRPKDASLRTVVHIKRLRRARRVGHIDAAAADVVAVGGEPKAGVGEEEGGEVGADDVGEVVEVVGPPGA